jgi:hypothetical protein
MLCAHKRSNFFAERSLFLAMTKLKAVGISVAVGTLLARIVVQHQSNERLRAEIAQLRSERAAPVAASVVAESNEVDAKEMERLRAEHLELMRLRAEAAALRQEQSLFTNAQAEIGQLRTALIAAQARPVAPTIPLAEGLKPASNFQNRGNLTPEFAFETVLWASGSHDSNALARSITFDEESRPKAEKILETAPESIRSRFGTAEQLVAYMMSRGTSVLGMRVLEQEQVTPAHYRLQTEWQYSDGRVQPNSWHFNCSSDGSWQMVIEPGMVDKLGRMLTAEAASIKARAEK